MARRPRKQKQIAPAAGVTAELRSRSRRRRDSLDGVAALQSFAGSSRNDLRPDLSVVLRPIDSLRPAARRVRRTERAQAAKLEASIRKFGLCQPLLVDQGGKIVHGHGIWEAARRLGLQEVPVIVVSHLTEAELRLLAIALNRLGETGEWDVEELKLEVSELIDLGEEVVLSGFEQVEIDALLLDDDGSEDDVVPPLRPSDPVSRPGDRWLLGRHVLVQGDARDRGTYERLFEPGEKARLVLTDTPFNVPNAGHVTSQAQHREFAMAHGEMDRAEFTSFCRAWMQAAAEQLVDGGLLATFIDWRSIELILEAGRELELSLLNIVVWAKSNGGQGSLWRSQHELLPIFKSGSASHVNNVALGRWGRWRSNVWNYPGASSIGSDAREGLAAHPTVKPRALLEDALLDVTNRGDLVLDCFLGSGSTLLAAETTGRGCRAVEIDGLYCDLAIRRWQDETGLKAKLSDTGEAFEEVEARRQDEGGADGRPQRTAVRRTAS